VATYRLTGLPNPPNNSLGWCTTCAVMYIAGVEDQQRELLAEEMELANKSDIGVYQIRLEPLDMTARNRPILEVAVAWGFSWLFRDITLPVCWTHIVPMLPDTGNGKPMAQSPIWTAPERRGRHDNRIDGESKPME
jgi:hypothetical protein